MKQFLLFSAMICAFSSSGHAQSADSLAIKKISDEIFMNGTAYSNLKYLCKKVGPRLSGSPGAALAVEQTARMLAIDLGHVEYADAVYEDVRDGLYDKVRERLKTSMDDYGHSH